MIHRLRQTWIICILLSITPLMIAGCAGFGKRLKPPRITLANIQVRELTLFETVFQIDLRVLNTNDAAFEIKGVECGLEFNGKKVASGVSSAQIKIAAFDSAAIPMVLYSSVLDMVKSLQGLQNKKQLKYRIKGKLHVAGGFLVPPVIPFKSAGKISWEGLTGSKE